MSDQFPFARSMVTGGAGFLGSAVIRRLFEAGADEVFVPRSWRCDLRGTRGIKRARADGQPQLITDAAAIVGGKPRRPFGTTRARERLGFGARMPWEEGLLATIDWCESWRGAGS